MTTHPEHMQAFLNSTRRLRLPGTLSTSKAHTVLTLLNFISFSEACVSCMNGLSKLDTETLRTLKVRTIQE